MVHCCHFRERVREGGMKFVNMTKFNGWGGTLKCTMHILEFGCTKLHLLVYRDVSFTIPSTRGRVKGTHQDNSTGLNA